LGLFSEFIEPFFRHRDAYRLVRPLRSTLVCSPSEACITMILQQRQTLRSSRNLDTCIIGCYTRGRQSEQSRLLQKDLTSEPATAIQTSVASDRGVQLAALTITATITVTDIEAACKRLRALIQRWQLLQINSPINFNRHQRSKPS
jgi:hypothetical protein